MRCSEGPTALAELEVVRRSYALSVKRRTKILIALGVLLAVGGLVAWQWDSILQAYVSHSVRTVTTSLPPCDRVEVFHLDGGGPRTATEDPSKIFSGLRSAGILSTQDFTGSDAEALAALWRSQTFGWDFQMLCHSPVYGFRFYTGNRLVFETTLCFHCSNFYVTVFGESGWWGFDAESPRARELLQRLQEVFPASIPKPK